jgi:hypothetical protein
VASDSKGIERYPAAGIWRVQYELSGLNLVALLRICLSPGIMLLADTLLAQLHKYALE